MGNLLRGQVALITGASQGGTGAAIARRFAAEGAAVAVTGRTVAGLAEAKDAISAAGGVCVTLPADMGEPSGPREELVATTESMLGPVDILVNSAAVGPFGSFEKWDRAELTSVFEVNLWGPWRLMQQVVPGMRARGHGSILNLTSFAGELPPGPPFPKNRTATDGSLYGASKAALNRLTVSAAVECAENGITANALTPQAAIRTPRLVARSPANAADPTRAPVASALFEPLETMAEAALLLVTDQQLTSRIAYSLQLLVERDQPVYELDGATLMAGWQPGEIRDVIQRQAAYLAGTGWPGAFDFRRQHTPDY
jgi:citronellol/citronellal dehydrogenase